ncbi:MAG: glycosidase [Melioribacteraceae bacterium]|nr:glycosidase [Melioribacteraceae bacterium]
MKLQNPKIYEINTRVFFRQLKNNNPSITLSAIPEDYWRNLKNLGIDIIWLMGVWKTVPSAVDKYCYEEGLIKEYAKALPDWRNEDVAGSPYAIDEYRVSEEFGGDDEIKSLKAKLNKMGLKLILDFIPNHFHAETKLLNTNAEIFLETDQESYNNDPHTCFKIENRNKYFVHGRDPFFPAWQDTVQINFFSEHARKYLTDILKSITDLCDGVRCDMAMLPLLNVFQNTWGRILSKHKLPRPKEEFWDIAIKEVKKIIKDFLFIAEVYWNLEEQLQDSGFDFTYDKSLLDIFENGNAESIRNHLLTDEDRQHKTVRFLENHDEKRAVHRFGVDKSMAAAVIINTIPGAKLFYDGQFEGRKVKLPVQLNRAPTEKANVEIQKFYKHLLEITNTKIFKYGEYKLPDTETSWRDNLLYKNILVIEWSYQNEIILIAVNFSQITSSCRVKIDLTSLGKNVSLIDILNNITYERQTDSLLDVGLYIELKPFASHIFKIEGLETQS